MNQKTYIKYFNYGYLLAQHEPKVLKRLLASKINDTSMLKGLEDGEVQFENEKEIDRILDIARVMKRTKDVKKDIKKDLEPDL